MHQLHYTSCEDGLEGIQGFQISALTPGAPKQLVDLAVRASAYEVGPQLANADESDLGAFPVAFGYARTGGSAVLFQTRYTGADFTGRTGNYFAHALLLGEADRELGRALPIDMWRGSVWVHSRQRGTDLPPVDALTPGSATSPADIRRFLSAPGGAGGLARVISAVQRVLTDGRGRVVLVVPDDRTAALWLAALCRSFPRALGVAISFVTYTSRPEDAGVLVSCTTPDVLLPSYGDFTVVDPLETGAEETTRYATMMAALWSRSDVQSAIMAADRLTSPLSAGELEAFAVLIECAEDIPPGRDVPEALLLDAVALAVERMPGTLPADGWQRLAGRLRAVGGPADLRRWANHLDAADRRREPVSADLLGTYYLAALTAPEQLWLPRLDPAQLDQVVAEAVLPAMTDPKSKTVLDRMAGQDEFRAATLRVLSARLTDPRQIIPLCTSLTPHAGQLLRRIGGRGRVALLADVVLAREGKEDRVSVLDKALDDHEVDWRRLGAVLWPAEVSQAEAERALSSLHPDVLVGTGLLSRIVARTLDQAARGQLGPGDAGLVDELLAPDLVGSMRAEEATMLETAKFLSLLQHASPKDDAELPVSEGLRLLPSLPAASAQNLLGALAEYVLRADTRTHHNLLETTLRETGGRFLETYGERASARLVKADPNYVASVIVVWWSVSDQRVRRRLVNETLVAAVARRKPKHLDRIGELLKSTAVRSRLDVAAPKGSWSKWWREWRSAHEANRGLLNLLGLRRQR
ncbi:hypothetical protein [Amycolatopsis sp. WQ 127309]|uniref:GAP1-N2 domain-containing protein n=1 Tax=Amycolatopsis sp. WQ 127309 TaxID=2932773 RepID=UPI001FF4240E|nr:hypothetical protein [Amycolatopsis sp. WQ 127309]UOZ07941.1 hypothetical protein MUY22_06570 [Amycolatopsis sp. WQ 127309]